MISKMPRPGLLAFFVTAALALGAKPNFSGDWKLNSAKSDFGEFPAPRSLSQKITHEEPSLKTATSMSTDNGDFDFEASYTTDGKECTNRFGPGEVKSTLKWDGDALVVESKGSFGENDWSMKDRWSLAGDGKTLSIDRVFSGSRGEMVQKLVLEKE